MKTMITPLQVVRETFGAMEPVSVECISEADIAAAENRYIAPALGAELHAALLEGRYADFVGEYVAPALALYTRYLVQPRLAVKTLSAGTVAPKTSVSQPATDKAQREQRKAVLHEARALLYRAVDHLNAHAGEFAEFDPAACPLNRCRIHGEFVEIR